MGSTRGRVYPLPSFSFIRGDHIRALFEFAEGKPIGDDGLKALKIHLANVAAGFDKSRPGNMTDQEKIDWVDARIDKLKFHVARPARDGQDVDETFLSEVDDRFQFIRACIELSYADGNPGYWTHLPILFDATASGPQHYCLLMRDSAGGRLVNLARGLPPEDLYQTVADEVANNGQFLVRKWEVRRPGKWSRTKVELPVMIDARVPGLFLELGERGRRKFAKGVLVPRIYSASPWKMSRDLRKAYQREDDKLFNPRRIVLTLLRIDYEDDGGFVPPVFVGYTPAQTEDRKHIVDACVDAVLAAFNKLMPKPREAMRFLRQLAELMASENKSLAMPMPSGFPWHSRYHEKKTRVRTTWIGERDVTTTVTVGEKPTVDAKAAIRAAAPNFVHGIDAALVHFAALGAREIPFVSVHDCFGFLAPDAARGRAMVHDRQAQMHLDHDPLAQILEIVRNELPPEKRKKLPPLPERGDQQMIEESRNAKYITS